MSSSLPITLLSKIKPYKTAWKIQVKILHSWKQYSSNSGETLELILADQEIHAAIRKNDVVRYEKYLQLGQWKIIQSICYTKLPFKMRRRQFPINVAFAMTINKSQGQSLSEVGVFLPRPVFSHGQLYVALSMVTSKKGLKLLIVDKDGKPQSKTTNVVFKGVSEFDREQRGNRIRLLIIDYGFKTTLQNMKNSRSQKEPFGLNSLSSK